MPIEFRCPSCQRLLRTADDTAGKQTKCPECGTVLPIPNPQAAAARPEPPLPTFVPNPYVSPAAAQPAGASTVDGGPVILDVGDVLSTTWKIFTDKLVPMLVGMLVLFGVTLVALIPLLLLLFFGVFVVVSLADAGNEPLAVVVGVVLFLVWMLMLMVFSFWLYGGIVTAVLKIARGQTAEIGDLFSGGKYVGAIFGASLLCSLMVMLGYIACIVPGIIVGLVFSQFIWLVVDRNAGAVESLSMSRDITRGNRLNLFLLALVVMGISMVAGFIPGSFLFTSPFFYLMFAVTYLRLTGQPTAEMATPWPPAPLPR